MDKSLKFNSMRKLNDKQEIELLSKYKVRINSYSGYFYLLNNDDSKLFFEKSFKSYDDVIYELQNYDMDKAEFSEN